MVIYDHIYLTRYNLLQKIIINFKNIYSSVLLYKFIIQLKLKVKVIVGDKEWRVSAQLYMSLLRRLKLYATSWRYCLGYYKIVCTDNGTRSCIKHYVKDSH